MAEQGVLFQINVSGGGVPKLARREAWAGSLGLEGDRQAHPKVHGGPERALCLYSLERILALQLEGHPIFPGAIGENLTLAGLDWAALGPGGRLAIGPALRIEITHPAAPCNSIAAAFRDGAFERVAAERQPGWARLYARVLDEGPLCVGDRVAVLRAGGPE